MVFENILRGILGLFSLIAISYLFSNNRRAINWKLVGMGIALQLVFAIGVLKVDFIANGFHFLSDGFVKVIGISHKGTEFLFGSLAEFDQPWGYIFAIQVLPNIIFFAAISALLYYLGVLQWVVHGLAWVMSKTMKLSGAESLSNAANIFLGQTEAPLMIKPYVEFMTRSEMLCIMVGGMANTAGSVLAAYVGFLGGGDVEMQKYFALHMLCQSIMSAPAAIVISKILFPQTEEDKIMRELKISKESIGTNALDAVSNGTSDGIKLAVNVGAILIVFTAFMYLFNYILFKVGDWTTLNAQITALSGHRYDGLSLQFIFGYVFAPLAWLMGVHSTDMLSMGQLLGEKTVINEFVAYISLGKMLNGHVINDPKTTLMATYALCGFANFASVGIQIGGIGAMAPGQRKTLAQLGMRALLGGTLACLMTAVVAGMLYSGGSH